MPAIEWRTQALRALAQPFDVIGVGVGVNGCRTAWDAALRGLRVLLVERVDLGSGTSSWSSRLIHGGLEYLEKHDVKLVRESLREREWLLGAAPHLVHPLRMVMPFHDGAENGPPKLMAGMGADDVLSWDKSVRHHSNFDGHLLLERGRSTSTGTRLERFRIPGPAGRMAAAEEALPA